MLLHKEEAPPGIKRSVLCTISKEEAKKLILQGYIGKGGNKQKAIMIPHLGAEESPLGDNWSRRKRKKINNNEKGKEL
jgi:hypothetical protein